MAAAAVPVVSTVIGAVSAVSSHRQGKKAQRAQERQYNEQKSAMNTAEAKIRGQEDKQREMIRLRKIGEYRGIGRSSMLLSRPYTGSSVEGTGNRETLG